MQKMKFKILLLNIEYGLDLNGSLFEYLIKGHRYFRCRKPVQSRAYMGLQNILKREKPDVCCLVEVDKSHAAFLKSRDFPYVVMDNKYGKGTLTITPKFKKKCNAALSRVPFILKKHNLKHGIKKLVYELHFANGLTLFLVHLAVIRSAVRKKQLDDLVSIMAGKKNVIVCGDFNIYKGFKELDDFIKKTGLVLANKKTDATFPSVKPKRPLDVFLYSKEIEGVELKVLHDRISDHRPVLFSLNI